MKNYNILVINPGSTSTKVAVFKNKDLCFEKTIRHSVEELKDFKKMAEQKHFRKEVIIKFLKDNDFDINKLDVIVARGGILKPIPSGTYLINDLMVETVEEARFGEHASNLGALIAKPLSDSLGINSYITDPVVVDELDDIARFTGHPEFIRKSIFHALNHKAVAKEIAESIGKKYEACNFILAHLGGGISVGAHCKGRIIDVNNALAGEGAFSPERSGTVPTGQLVDMCFSGQYSKEEICKKLLGLGGVSAYLGTNNMIEVEERVKNGDEKALIVLKAMAYQVAKEIGAYATVLKGAVDCIIITGGLAYDKYFVELIKERVSFIAEVKVFPGEDELRSLATSAYRVLNNQEKAINYN